MLFWVTEWGLRESPKRPWNMQMWSQGVQHTWNCCSQTQASVPQTHARSHLRLWRHGSPSTSPASGSQASRAVTFQKRGGMQPTCACPPGTGDKWHSPWPSPTSGTDTAFHYWNPGLNRQPPMTSAAPMWLVTVQPQGPRPGGGRGSRSPGQSLKAWVLSMAILTSKSPSSAQTVTAMGNSYLAISLFHFLKYCF